MARGSQIIVSAEPRGVYKEGTISGSSIYPGTVMQIQTGTSVDSKGRFTYVTYAPSADGDPRPPIVLLPDDLQGQLYTTAYTTGTRCFLYVPLAGEELNMVVAPQPGTGSADAYTVGERLMPSHTSGQLVVESTSSNPAWFVALEHIDIAANVVGWVWCMKS